MGWPLFWILLSALILRLFLSYFQYSGDVKNHLAWGNGFINSPIGFYSQHFPGFNDANYPPITIFLFAISNLLLLGVNNLFNSLNHSFLIFPSFFVPLFLSQNMQMVVLKLPAIFSDIGIGYLIYRFTSTRHSRYLPLILSSLYLFNPAVIYISSVWGQIESVTIFFLLLSLYQIIYTEKNKYLSIFIFGVAALTKQTALWFLPLYFFLWLKELNIKDLGRGVLSGILVFIISYLPFGLGPFSAIQNYFSTLSGSSNTVSDAAWNLWFFLFPSITPDSIRLGLITIRQSSVVLLCLSLFLILISLFKKYSLPRFFNALFFWSLAVFFLQTRVHERHLAFSLVFLLLTPGIVSRYFVDYLVLSLYHFSNIYFVLRLPFIK